MPHYFFDIRYGSILAPDEDGLELSDVNAAERHAVFIAAEVQRDLPDAPETTLTVHVINDDGEPLKSLSGWLPPAASGGSGFTE
jgi:hypothetical protein